MKAVVLAGGYGTRLWPLTLTRPKPMLLLGGKPALHYIIEYLSNHGFDEIIITANYLRNSIMDYFGRCSELDVKLIYSDEYSPLGTAGSVKNVANYLDDTFAVIQGDNITDIDLTKMLEFHKKKGGDATIALKEVEKPYFFGIVKMNSEEQILLFKEKPKASECFSNMINTGIYMLEPKILDYVPSDKEFDFAKDLFPQLLNSNKKIYGFKAEGFWVDIGTPEGYLEASNWLLSKLKGRSISGAEVKDAIIKGPLVIGKDSKVDDNAMIYGPAVIGDRCHIESGAIIDSYTMIESDVEVSTNTSVRKSIIYKDTFVGPYSLLDGCIIAEGCNIGLGVKISDKSIVGAGCEIGHLTNIQNGSKIWPSIKVRPKSVVKGFVRHLEQIYQPEIGLEKIISETKIIDKENARRILERLPPEKAFYFFKGIGDYIGQVANSLDEFCNLLNVVSVDSIEFHVKRNDFENWIKFIGDLELANCIKKSGEKNLRGKALRKEIHDLVEKRCRELHKVIDQ
ncbi:MAG: DUF5752 family protein [Nitrososphaerales archaeon]